jgi:outer membrane protein assembly factor BamE (lipoprotein component of BamABCDE complex)
MNKIKFIFISVVFTALAGCATKTTTTGREFDVAKISAIKKGTTTSEELIGLLGQPLEKSALSQNEAIWDYSWKKTSSNTTQGSDGTVVTSQGDKKTLEALIKNGVVENYIYQDDPFWIEKLKGSQ